MKNYFYNELYCLTLEYFEKLFNEYEIIYKFDIDNLTKSAIPYFRDVLSGKIKLLIQCYPVNFFDDSVATLINQYFIDKLSYIFYRYSDYLQN